MVPSPPAGRLAGLGLSRAPLLTLAVAALTAAVGVAGLLSPEVLAALQRTPAALHGELWRWLTSLLVQDGGLAGTASNLLGLLAVGAAAEQVLDRGVWLGLYLAGGLVGQVAGQLWQPFGGGNSVAVCGLAGALAWLVARPALPRWGGPAVALWAGVLLAGVWAPLVAVGVLAAGLDRFLIGHPARHRVVLVGGVAVVAAALVAAADIHGAALATGLVLGAPLALRGNSLSSAAPPA
jgi:hypothetical protein